MALIRCPRCGEEISDKAAYCVHCGQVLSDYPRFVCPECGAPVSVMDTVCPKCGCPLPDEYDQAPQKKKLAGRIISILLFLVFFTGAAWEYVSYTAYNTYVDTTNEIIDSRNESVDAFNDCYHLLLSVWLNAILEKQDPETDPFVCPNGSFVNDFNEAITNLYSDADFSGNLELIYTHQSRLRQLRKELQNPPSEFADYNEILLQLVDNEIEMAMVLLSPSGSYEDISQRLYTLFETNNILNRELAFYEQ